MADFNRNRQFSIQVFFLLATLLLVGKALDLQVIKNPNKEETESTGIGKYTVYPARGLVFDRNEKLLVNNNPMYDLMVVYNQIDPQMDTTAFCDLLGIDKAYFNKALQKNWRSRRFSKSVPFTFLSKITAATAAKFQERLYAFPGFILQLRNARGYPDSLAAHVLGYIREVNNKEVKLDEYVIGDYIGASGLELAYEDSLRGDKGIRYYLKDNLGREAGSYKNGKLDDPPEAGRDLITTLDKDLQQYGELLMQNKVGSIVAIEPKTGDILTMVSAPTYNPQDLVIGEARNRAYIQLDTNPYKPFLDRSIMAQYPPGSLFKPIVALIALQDSLLQADRTILCAGAYYLNGERLTGCHSHPTCTNVSTAIQHSCNTYFVTLFREIIDQRSITEPQYGLDRFNSYLTKWGFGSPLGIDFPNEKGGNYPTSAYFDELFDQQQKGQKWRSAWIRSLGIGQGELLSTNLQLANQAAILANRGWYITPHLVKKIRDEAGNVNQQQRFLERKSVGIDARHFDPVVQGMSQVTYGTAPLAHIPDITLAGKTGTAENNQRTGKDHSIFFAFAPVDDPKIAIAVYVENGGWGGSYAAPIASLIIEHYLRDGEISDSRKWIEDRMLKANLLMDP
ncbi:MAG: penicillin-binding protein 2 [Bacteroidota bacterium]